MKKINNSNRMPFLGAKNGDLVFESVLWKK